MYNYYYLVYKVKNSNILWIFDESNNKDELFNRISDVNSNNETYYIIKKKYNKEIIDIISKTKFKRFKKFKSKFDYTIIYKI